jgi:mucin-19
MATGLAALLATSSCRKSINATSEPQTHNRAGAATAGAIAQFYNPSGVAADINGNLFVADAYNNAIRKITPDGAVYTLAGNGEEGAFNGPGASASFNVPWGITVDHFDNVYVADENNNQIRKIDMNGNVTTLAGSVAGFRDGPVAQALFDRPIGVACDGSGNVYVVEGSNNRIRRITRAGEVSTLAGSDAPGFNDGPGATALFNSPTIVSNPSGIIFVADQRNNRIRRVSNSGYVTTIAGGTEGTRDGQGTAAQFSRPVGIAVDGAGNLYTGDRNQLLRKITADGIVTTLAGKTSLSTSGFADGTKALAQFGYILGLTSDLSGNVYIGESTNRIRKWTSSILSTVAGTGTPGFVDGPGAPTHFWAPDGIYADSVGNVWVSDGFNNRIRVISPNGVISTMNFAGDGKNGYKSDLGPAAEFSVPSGIAVAPSGVVYVVDAGNKRVRFIVDQEASLLAGNGVTGFVNNGVNSEFSFPQGLALDAAGNVFVADYNNNSIRKITPQGVVSTFAGTSTPGFTDGSIAIASFNRPYGIQIDKSGNIYVCDAGNLAIRKITPAGMVSTLAGNGTYGFTNGTGAAATFNNPLGIGLDDSGNIFVADDGNNAIRKVTPAGVVTTVAGLGPSSPGFRDGAVSIAQFTAPFAVTVDKAGILYVADNVNNRIRKITPNGIVSTIGGDGTGNYQ